MKKFNVLDFKENLILSNVTFEEAVKFINGRNGFLLEEI